MAVAERPLTRDEVNDYRRRLDEAGSDSERVHILRELDERIRAAKAMR